MTRTETTEVPWTVDAHVAIGFSPGAATRPARLLALVEAGHLPRWNEFGGTANFASPPASAACRDLIRMGEAREYSVVRDDIYNGVTVAVGTDAERLYMRSIPARTRGLAQFRP